MIRRIADALRRADRLVITSHVGPDGDSIGSQLALAEALEKLGKQVQVINRDPVPENFMALPACARIELDSAIRSAVDAYLLLECSDVERSGLSGFDPSRVKINIDHHLDNTSYGDVNWVDVSASSVGEMGFHLLRELGVDLTPSLATHLYLAVSSDTGCFRYSNASPAVFAVGRELLLAGAERDQVNDMIFNSNSYTKMAVMGRVLQTLEREPDGRLVWIHIRRGTIAELGATKDDLEGMVNLPLSIAGVEVAFFVKEVGAEEFKVSLRSRSAANVYEVAKQFGGGGHFHASGCTLEGDFDSVVARVRRAAHRELLAAGLRRT
ncbi:MAG TPA: bifunctional oligoribonuclease/PAP phosphatase NrnA [Acidobacteriota bacterium]